MNPEPDQEQLGVRVLSYNVRSLRDDSAAVAAVIRSCRPDVVCIQEAPRFWRWRAKCARLARSCGLVVVTGGRPAGAMMLLAHPDVQIISSRDVLLTKAPRLHQRGLAIAHLAVRGTELVVASMHLDLVAAERLRHVAEVLGVLAESPAPLVLAGDVNERSHLPAWQALATALVDGWVAAQQPLGELTYSAVNPFERIDAVFVSPSLRVLTCGVPPGLDHATVTRASDHLPVLAVVENRSREPDQAVE